MTASTKRAPGRPKTPLDIAEREGLIRVAALAAHIMETLRLPEYRGRYSSERQSRHWATDKGHRFTSADFSPALWLLADTGRLRRAPDNSGTGRGGWITPTVEWTTESPVTPSGNGDQ